MSQQRDRSLIPPSPPSSGQISVDQSRNQILAKISESLANLLGENFGVTTVAAASTYVVRSSDRLIDVDASGGNVTITYSPTLMVGVQVRIAKIDTSGNSVIISPDGSTTAASFATPASGSVVASKVAWSDGTTLWVT